MVSWTKKMAVWKRSQMLFTGKREGLEVCARVPNTMVMLPITIEVNINIARIQFNILGCCNMRCSRENSTHDWEMTIIAQVK